MFLQFKSQVSQALTSALEANSLEITDLSFEESIHADIASSVAFRLAPVCRQSPKDIAEMLAGSIELPKDGLIDRVETSGPYLNFFVNPTFLGRTLSDIRALGPDYGAQTGRGKVILEHTSANPNGPLHVGHIRNSIIGDILARILKKAGYEVETQYYINDMGRQIAIVSWALEHFDFDTSKKSDHAIADIYIKANRVLKDEPEKVAEIDELMQRIEHGDLDVAERFKHAVDLAMEGIKHTLECMNVHHDSFAWESTYVRNSDVSTTIDRIKDTGRAVVDDGALMVNLTDYGFEKKLVIQRSDGTSLYTTRDLAYHLWKAGQCDRMIDVLGADHKLISGQLKAVLNSLGENEPEIVIFEFVSLPEGSMSTRQGKFISTDELLDQIDIQAMAEVEKRRPDTDDDFKHKVANFVGIGAVRYDVVKVSPEKSTVFDWREALDFEKQGAPFIQYSHARACSIMVNAEESGINLAAMEYDISMLVEDQEIELIKNLARFSAVIDSAASDLKPHHLATYARELADSFNQFYRYVPVLNAEPQLRDSRLVLVDCARIVLAIVLGTLGIYAPKNM
ncbi:MAG: arginine--tRNA ligase [Methanosarcinales archaeon]|nr:arginine--tRNA ligase [Methanosarcinales archaeon]